MSALFDTYVMVDWSARATPSPVKPSKDAIWIGVARAKSQDVETSYWRTRHDAETHLTAFLATEVKAGRRVLAGFDFPFGYPQGFGAKVAGKASPLALWDWLDEQLSDGEDNANNRFDVASAINRSFDGVGPFWGTPASRHIDYIPPTKVGRTGRDRPPERRICEDLIPSTKTVWQLTGAGAVGSQVLTGLPVLARLRARFADHLSVWPFDAGFTAPDKAICLVEIYPSLFMRPANTKPDEIADEEQVRATAAAYRSFDQSGDLNALFTAPPSMGEDDQTSAREEGWILGVGHDDLLRSVAEITRPPRIGRLRYERDPAAIYAASFATVRAEAQLDHLPEDLQDVAIRLVHSCGMTDIPNRLAWSDDVVRAASSALMRGKPVICDCEMVRSGIIGRFLPKDVELIVTLNEPSVPERARKIATTRSAAAVELWAPYLDGAVVVIGNAPTALFHLLELIDEGAARPAAILGFPVGFIGAAESKAELAARPRDVPFLTLRGRRGGSAMASAALNAIAGGLG